jgi:hypothetical protein
MSFTELTADHAIIKNLTVTNLTKSFSMAAHFAFSGTPGAPDPIALQMSGNIVDGIATLVFGVRGSFGGDARFNVVIPGGQWLVSATGSEVPVGYRPDRPQAIPTTLLIGGNPFACSFQINTDGTWQIKTLDGLATAGNAWFSWPGTIAYQLITV